MTNPDNCYVGIDVGTSGCRAIAINAAREIIAEARTELPPSQHSETGGSEQNPKDWWNAVTSVLTELTKQTSSSVKTIAVDATSSTLLLADRKGRPLTPALMYNDRRALEQAKRIAEIAPADSPASGPGSALAKLLYLLDTIKPDETPLALHQADWLNGKLTGHFGLADENNVLKLGFNPADRRWPEWLKALELPDGLLPKVQPIGSVLGTIEPSVTQQLGLPNDVKIIAGTTDSNAATLAAGISETADAVTSLGSTLVLKVLGDRPVTSARYGVYSHRIGDRWLIGGASNSGGAVLKQFFSDDELGELSAAIDPSIPSGLDYYPLPSTGERFPHNDPEMAPRLTPPAPDRKAFLHGLLESIANIEAEGYRRLAELGAPYPRRVFSSGGGAVNETWRQIRERVLGMSVINAERTEAAYGAAMLALNGCNVSAISTLD